jgi:hypothetical protein
MHFDWDTLTFVNLILCVAILAFGIISWQRAKANIGLYVGIAFGLFGLTHLLSLLGTGDTLNTVLIVIRIIAYLLIILALFFAAYKKE